MYYIIYMQGFKKNSMSKIKMSSGVCPQTTKSPL